MVTHSAGRDDIGLDNSWYADKRNTIKEYVFYDSSAPNINNWQPTWSKDMTKLRIMQLRVFYSGPIQQSDSTVILNLGDKFIKINNMFSTNSDILNSYDIIYLLEWSILSVTISSFVLEYKSFYSDDDNYTLTQEPHQTYSKNSLFKPTIRLYDNSSGNTITKFHILFNVEHFKD